MKLFSLLFGQSKMKMPVKLYLDLISQPCRTLDLFARVNSINFEFKNVNLLEGQQHSDEFKKLNPLSKAPVMEENGILLTESVAIAKYLCRENNVADHWYPKDSLKQARVDEVIEWHHIGLRAPTALYVIEQCFKPKLFGRTPNPGKIAFRHKEMVEAIDRLNDIWLGDKKFLAGDEISLADLFAVNEIEQLRLTGYDPREGRPKLACWMERIRDKCNPHYDKLFVRINELAGALKEKSKL